MYSIDKKNLFEALMILFFISRTKKVFFRLDDHLGDYFSSGWRCDMFVDFCEDLKFYLTEHLLLPDEEKFTDVESYCLWYNDLILKTNPDRVSLRKWICHSLIALDYYPGEKQVAYFKRLLSKQIVRTTSQRLYDVKQKVSKQLQKL